MTAKVQHREPLPQSLMEAIAAITRTGDLSHQTKLDAVILMATGYGLYAQAETVDPTAFAIPQEQWEKIASQLASAINGPIAPSISVNAMLSWMNYGPSGYVVDEETKEQK